MRLSVEECVYWSLVASLDFCGAIPSRAQWIADLCIKRDAEQLREEARVCIEFARVHTNNERRAAWLTLRALCRAAIRAIEAERSGRR